MGEAAKKEDEEEKFVPVGPGADGLPEAKKADEPEREPDEEDERLAQQDDADEEGGDKPTARKKESAKERRDRAKKARDRERLELNFFMKRNEELEKRLMVIEGRTAQNETAAVDQRITAIQAQITNADRVLTEALKKPNGAGAEEFVEAQRIRDQLRDQLATLSTTKQAHEKRQKAEAAERDSRAVESAPVMKKPDPRVIRNAKAWADDHDWFDFSGTDEDSVIVRALDESLAAEGYDPTTDEYWEELTSRVKRRLPERFKSGARSRADEDDDVQEDERPRPKAGPKFSAGGKERPLKRNEVYVSAERKQAMKDYGVWDDPVARNRMLSRYAKFDADTSASKQS